MHASFAQWILGIILILSAMGVALFRKPIYASLSFLLSLVMLAFFYLHLSAEFIALMQILVYAGAILVIFIFVIVLFQDAHQQVRRFKPKSQPQFLAIAGIAFIVTLAFFGAQLIQTPYLQKSIPDGFGSAQSIGMALYLDFFFPFEAIIVLFLVAIIGALYTAKRER
jgi:NADH-quinone oxidoreductase subunit J